VGELEDSSVEGGSEAIGMPRIMGRKDVGNTLGSTVVGDELRLEVDETVGLTRVIVGGGAAAG
jgi:hypothetical protein